MSNNAASSAIKSIDAASIHRITSGQVVIDLQTAVKELLENSLDAGATNIEVKFKNHGLTSIEVVDNGSGIAEKDHDSIGRKHHTSKLSSFNDLTTVTSFGFRGEALSSLCALCESVTITTATAEKAPMGTVLDLAKSGEVAKSGKAVRQRGTTILLKSPFSPLPVRRKEFERNAKREFGKALALLNAYAVGPCCGLGSEPESSPEDASASNTDSQAKAVRLLVTNQPDKGQKTTHVSIPLPRTGASPSVRIGISALWGPKALDGVIDLDLKFDVPKIVPRNFGRKQTTNQEEEEKNLTVRVNGLISSPLPVPGSGSTSRSGTGRSGTDRQFFYVNGRPCALTKIQKVINETYRSFSPSAVVAAQFPFVVANFTVSGDAIDVNVTPDKRTVLLHAETHIIDALKAALEELFQPSRSTFGVNGTSTPAPQPQAFGHQRSASMRPPAQAPSVSNSFVLSRSVSLGSRPRRKDSLIVAPVPDVDEEDEVEEGLLGFKPASKVARQTEDDDIDDDADTSAAMDVDTDNPTVAAGTSTGASARHISSPTVPSSIAPSSTPPLSKALVEALDNAKRADKEKDKPKSSVVLSTSKASWSHIQASSSAASVSPVTQSVGDDRANKEVPGLSPDDDDEEEEPPRKRQKSAPGLDKCPAVNDDEEDDDEDELAIPSVSRVKTKVASTSLTVATIHSRAPKSAGTSSDGLRQTRLTDSLKGGASRRDLRSKLAGFARTGSQVQQPSSDAEEEAGNEDNHDEVATRQMRREEPVDRDDEGPERRPGGQGKSQIIVDENLPLFLLEDENEDHDPKSNDMDLDLEATSSSVASANTSSVIGPPSTIATSALPSSSDIVNLVDDDDDDQGHTSSLLSTGERERQLSESRASQPVDRPEVIRTASSQTSYGDVHLRFNLTGIARRWSALRERLRIARERSAQIQDVMADQRQTLDSDGGVGEDATFSDSAQEAEAKLARVIDKKDFGKMDVIGQFNLGFIIVRKKVHGDAAIESDNGTHSEEDASQDVLDDLFIVDQHAADEKYNFETLQQTTNIQSQKLFRPQALELTASDELVAIENLDVLKKNGFELEVPEDPDVEMLDDETSGTQVHRRLKLVAQPVSKSTMFDMKDLEELIHLLQDRPTGQMVRCSKARAMFASRACRKSVMVGMPLTKGQMTTVVQHMGTMDQPWNCPHGRPTMRHLFDMSNINSDTKPSLRVRKKVNWSTFA